MTQGRPFVSAVLMSLLWHAFWFFSITIVINPHMKDRLRERPTIVSLGAVLDDSIFKTILEARDEASESYYRRLSDLDVPVTVDSVSPGSSRYNGEVVSVPFARRLWSAARHFVGGSKISPDMSFPSEKNKDHRGDS